MYVHIEDEQVFLIAKIIGGTQFEENGEIYSTVGRDNTCGTFKEFGFFLENAKEELEDLIKEYEIESNIAVINNDIVNNSKYMKIIDQLSKYKDILDKVLIEVPVDQIRLATLDNKVTNTILSEVYSIVIDSQTNRDPYLQAKNSIFSVAHETYISDNNVETGIIPQKTSTLGTSLRKKLSDIKAEYIDYDFTKFAEVDKESGNIDDYIKRLREKWIELSNNNPDVINYWDKGIYVKIKKAKSKDEVLSCLRYLPSFENLNKKFSNDELKEARNIENFDISKKQIQEAWNKCGYSYNWNKAEGILDFIKQNIESDIKKRYILDYDLNTILSYLKEEWDFLFPARNNFYELLNNTAGNNKLRADKLSVAVQFFLGITNIYVYEKYSYNINFGTELDSNLELSQELASRVKLSLENSNSIEDTVLYFIEENLLNKDRNFFTIFIPPRKFDEEDKLKIKDKFAKEYSAIKNAHEFDEFFFLKEDKSNKLFPYGNAISCEFNYLVDLVKESYPDFLTPHEDFHREKKQQFDKNAIHFQAPNYEIRINDLQEKILATNPLTLELFEKAITKFSKNDNLGKSVEEKNKSFIMTLAEKMLATNSNIVDIINIIMKANLTDYLGDWLLDNFKKDILKKNENNENVLHIIAKSMNLDMLQKIIAKLDDGEYEKLHTMQDNSGKTPLHIAVSQKNIWPRDDICQYLISEKSINMIDNDGNTPIMILFQRHKKQEFGLFSQSTNIYLIKELLSKKSDINIINKNDKTIVDFIIDNSNYSLLELIDDTNIDLGRKDKNKDSYLFKLLNSKSKINVNIMDYFLSHTDILAKNLENKSVLDIVLENYKDDYITLDCILNKLKTYENILNNVDLRKHSYTLAFWSIKKQLSDISYEENQFLEKICDNITDQNEKDYVLAMACMNNNESIVKKMLEKNANPDATEPRFHGAHLIYHSLENNNQEIFDMMLAKSNLSAEEKSNLLYLALDFKNEYLNEKIQEIGGCYDSPCHGGDLPLHMAGINREIKLFIEILDKTADINHKNDSGKSILFDLLCGVGIPHLQEKVDALLAKPQIEVTHIDDATGSNILHLIASNNNLDISPTTLSKILDSGVDLNATNNNGMTPIQLAHNKNNSNFLEHIGEITQLGPHSPTNN